MMQGLRVTFFVLFLIYSEISTVVSGDEMIQMLRKKVTGLEDSLSMDIKFIRQDIKKNSDEFIRLANLIENARAAIDGEPVISGVANKELESKTKQSDISQGFELANRRLKRAFAEEKVVLRKFTSRMKSEIDHLAKEIRDALGEFEVSHVKTNNDFGENFDSFKTDLTQDLNQFMADLGTNLTNSVNTMSLDIAKETNDAVSRMEKLSDNIGIVPGIKNSVDDIAKDAEKTVSIMEIISENFEAVSNFQETINDFLSNKIKPIDAKLDDIYAILVQLKRNKENIDENENGRVRLANILRTEKTIAGRLEVYANNEWGTVCDDSFGIGEARVACRMLGYSSAHSYKDSAFYGQGTGSTWLDELDCSGRESSLFDCQHRGIGVENCGHDEDVGVRCYY